MIHEAGHFLVALAVRMRPRRFYLFFPPAIVKKVHNGIEYGIGAIPLGGYVKIPGMHKPAERDLEVALARALEEAPWLERDLEPVRGVLTAGRFEEAAELLPGLEAAVERAGLSEPAARAAKRGLTDVADALSRDAYWRASAWKRIAVIFAGPGTNLVFAVLMLAIVFMLGVPEERTRSVDQVTTGSPAAATGLKPGDKIVAVEGRPTRSFEAVSREIRGSKGNPITLTVLRDGRRTSLGPVEAEKAEDGRYVIGFVPGLEYRRYGPIDATWRATAKTWEVTVVIGEALGRIVTGSGREELSSPVGIVQGSSQALDLGFRYYLGVLALISLSLALLNLLPLLPLDGGHIAFSILEKIRGRAIPREAYERFSAVGIGLVLLLFFIGLSNDIGRLGGT